MGHSAGIDAALQTVWCPFLVEAGGCSPGALVGVKGFGQPAVMLQEGPEPQESANLDGVRAALHLVDDRLHVGHVVPRGAAHLLQLGHMQSHLGQRGGQA